VHECDRQTTLCRKYPELLALEERFRLIIASAAAWQWLSVVVPVAVAAVVAAAAVVMVAQEIM